MLAPLDPLNSNFRGMTATINRTIAIPPDFRGLFTTANRNRRRFSGLQ
jgi:hypothetical protein